MKHTMKLFALFALLLIGVKGNAQDKGIKFFQGTWEEALTESKNQNKPIFLDAYASWCGPCKMMAKNTFTKEKAGEYFNANFINVKMDMEKGEGPALSHKLGITAYPTLFFIDDKGKVFAKSIGYHTASALVDIGIQALELNKKGN